MAKKEKKQDKQKPKGGEQAKQAKKEKKGGAKEVTAPPEGYVPRLRRRYREEVTGALTEKFGFDNPMRVPTVEKVILNVGIGDAHSDQKLLDSVVEELEVIAGQRPVVTRARKAISNFKLRAGMQVGVRVTLRRSRMWEFLDKLFNLAMPRVRDFRGVSDRSFDGRGNFSLGIKEQIVFPEINYDKVEKIHGMDITIVTTAPNDEEARELLSLLGCPFRRKEAQAAA
ncbi:MAG: 50S ribosomal protein L5 [Calditrichaeota bacterium]|nr:50S ribosomal protein L5 [Calditrichota bacterium]